MLLNEIAGQHPLIYELTRQLLNKGEMVMLSVVFGGQQISQFAGKRRTLVSIEYEPLTEDYEMTYYGEGVSLQMYFTPGSHLETFNLTKQSDEEHGVYWLLSGEWESTKSNLHSTHP